MSAHWRAAGWYSTTGKAAANASPTRSYDEAEVPRA